MPARQGAHFRTDGVGNFTADVRVDLIEDEQRNGERTQAIAEVAQHLA